VRQGTTLILYTLFALLLQSAIVPLLVGNAFTIDLLVIYVVYLGMRRHSVGAVVASFVLGYLQDTISGTAYGLHAFTMTLVYTLVHVTSRHLWVENALSQIAVVGVAATIKHLAAALVLALFWGSGEVGTMLGALGWSVVVTALLSPPVFAILERADELAVEERD